MAVFILLWPYLLTTKLRCFQKNNIGYIKMEDLKGILISFVLTHVGTKPSFAFACNGDQTKLPYFLGLIQP